MGLQGDARNMAAVIYCRRLGTQDFLKGVSKVNRLHHACGIDQGDAAGEVPAVDPAAGLNCRGERLAEIARAGAGVVVLVIPPGRLVASTAKVATVVAGQKLVVDE